MPFLIWTAWTIIIGAIAFASYIEGDVKGYRKGYNHGYNKATSEAYKSQESKHIDRSV